MKVHPVIHFLAKNIIRLVLIFIFVGIPSATLYLRTEGIGFGAKEALGKALSSNAIEVKINRLALDPFAGLLAQDVLLRERMGSGRVIAKISNVALSLNLSELMARRVVVDKLSLENAKVSIPVEEREDARRIKIEDVHAEIVLLGDQLRLSRFDGIIEGVRVQLTGQFLHPEALRMPITKSEATKNEYQEILARVLQEFAKLSFPEGPPTINADIEADLADIETLQILNLNVRAREIKSSDWSINDVELHGEFSNGFLKVSRIVAHDAIGSLEISADWSHSERKMEIAILSTLQPGPFLRAFTSKNGILYDLNFDAPPQIEARVVADFTADKPFLSAMGTVFAPEIELKKIHFRDSGFSFAWKDGVFYARNIKCHVGDGELTGHAWLAPNDFRLVIKDSIPPPALGSLFDTKTREFLDNMEFKDLPEVSLSLHGTKPDFANIRGSGSVRLGRTAIRKSWLDNANSDFEIGDRCVTYRNFQVAYGDGKATGTFAYDVGLQEARLENVKSTLVPHDVLMWIDPKIAEAVVPYRFRAAPAAVVQGMIHLKDATKNKLSITLESAAGLDYDLLGRTLQFGKTSAQIDVIGAKLNANVKRAELLGGDISLKAIVSIDEKDPTFGADVTLNRVNFARLTKLYFNYDDSKGVMSGRYKFDARMKQETLMRGEGSVRVEDGNVFAIPVFGPFSEILGIGYQTARLATADFRVANEIINTKNLIIEGAGFSMFGSGDIHFVTSRLDMNMRINARGIPGLVFYPMSKLFEYVSTGTVSVPAWRPRIIPRFKSGANNESNPKKQSPP